MAENNSETHHTDNGLSETAELTLGGTIRGRQEQVKTLIALFGKKHHATPGSIFVYGHTSTGKTLVLQRLMSHFKLPYVFINCIECINSRVLFENILNNLPAVSDDGCANDLSRENDTHFNCDDMTSFVQQLKKTVSKGPLGEQTLYLVFDKAERIREADSFLLPALLRLQELSGLNLCTIFISEIVWEKFRQGTGFCEPFLLHFPDYSKQELLEIMALDCPGDCDQDLYVQYLNMVMSVFHMVCRDLRELRHLARLNLKYFLEPIISGEADKTQSRKLWKHMEPHLKTALRSVYLREVSSRQWEALQQAQLQDPEADIATGAQSRSHIELPYYSKFLLIAAYLASYNPMKYDRRFFAKYAGKTSKRSKLIKKNERASNHLLGPKVFPVDRLMAIFYSIVEGKVIPSAYISIQISSLVKLHLLCQIGGDDKITMPKYKCTVSLDFIRSIARTVHFDIMRYLYDFL